MEASLNPDSNPGFPRLRARHSTTELSHYPLYEENINRKYEWRLYCNPSRHLTYCSHELLVFKQTHLKLNDLRLLFGDLDDCWSWCIARRSAPEPLLCSFILLPKDSIKWAPLELRFTTKEKAPRPIPEGSVGLYSTQDSEPESPGFSPSQYFTLTHYL